MRAGQGAFAPCERRQRPSPDAYAEIGAAFLCCDLGITATPREDHAAYLASWLKVLKEDKRAIFQAAAYAQKAADYLHGLQPSPAAP